MYMIRSKLNNLGPLLVLSLRLDEAELDQIMKKEGKL
jgi:hypothetical protein